MTQTFQLKLTMTPDKMHFISNAVLFPTPDATRSIPCSTLNQVQEKVPIKEETQEAAACRKPFLVLTELHNSFTTSLSSNRCERLLFFSVSMGSCQNNTTLVLSSQRLGTWNESQKEDRYILGLSYTGRERL